MILANFFGRKTQEQSTSSKFSGSRYQLTVSPVQYGCFAFSHQKCFLKNLYFDPFHDIFGNYLAQSIGVTTSQSGGLMRGSEEDGENHVFVYPVISF